MFILSKTQSLLVIFILLLCSVISCIFIWYFRKKHQKTSWLINTFVLLMCFLAIAIISMTGYFDADGQSVELLEDSSYGEAIISVSDIQGCLHYYDQEGNPYYLKNDGILYDAAWNEWSMYDRVVLDQDGYVYKADNLNLQQTDVGNRMIDDTGKHYYTLDSCAWTLCSGVYTAEAKGIWIGNHFVRPLSFICDSSYPLPQWIEAMATVYCYAVAFFFLGSMIWIIWTIVKWFVLDVLKKQDDQSLPYVYKGFIIFSEFISISATLIFSEIQAVNFFNTFVTLFVCLIIIYPLSRIVQSVLYYDLMVNANDDTGASAIPLKVFWQKADLKTVCKIRIMIYSTIGILTIIWLALSVVSS